MVTPAMMPKSGDRSVKPNRTPPSKRVRPRRVADGGPHLAERLARQRRDIRKPHLLPLDLADHVQPFVIARAIDTPPTNASS